MNNIFILVHFLLILIFSLSTPCLVIAGGPPSDDIKQAANEGINVFLKDKRMSGLHHFGFMSQYDIDNAELGEGFQIFTIAPDKLLNESASQDIQSLVSATNQWQFLIVSNNNIKTLLKVALVDGEWIPVSIGSSELAKTLGSILEAWPISAGHQFRLIRVYQATSDFIELSQGSKVLGIIPVTSQLAVNTGEVKKAFNPRDLRAPKDVISDLRPVIKQNIQFVK